MDYANNNHEQVIEGVPCELCNTLVNFEDYEDHLRRCMITRMFPSYNALMNEHNEEEETNDNENINISQNNDEQQPRRILQLDLNDLSYFQERFANLNLIITRNRQFISTSSNVNFPFINHTPTNSASASDSNNHADLHFDFNNLNFNSNVDGGEDADDATNIPVFRIPLAPFIQYAIISMSEPEEIDEYEFNTILENMIGKVRVGFDDITGVSTELDREEISKLVECEEFCPVCRELFTLESNVVKTTCRHCFCKECLSKWLYESKKCPYCMVELHAEEKFEQT